MKCIECGVPDGKNSEVVAVTEFWSCGGRGVGDFTWHKNENENILLCQNCESTAFINCDECGAFIDVDCVFGMEAYNDDGKFLGLRCPGCDKLS